MTVWITLSSRWPSGLMVKAWWLSGYCATTPALQCTYNTFIIVTISCISLLANRCLQITNKLYISSVVQWLFRYWYHVLYYAQDDKLYLIWWETRDHTIHPDSRSQSHVVKLQHEQDSFRFCRHDLILYDSGRPSSFQIIWFWCETCSTHWRVYLIFW